MTLEGVARNRKTGARRPVKLSVAAADRYSNDTICPCSGPCRCDVEPDGVCANGWESKLLAVGVI